MSSTLRTALSTFLLSTSLSLIVGTPLTHDLNRETEDAGLCQDSDTEYWDTDDGAHLVSLLQSATRLRLSEPSLAAQPSSPANESMRANISREEKLDQELAPSWVLGMDSNQTRALYEAQVGMNQSLASNESWALNINGSWALNTSWLRSNTTWFHSNQSWPFDESQFRVNGSLWFNGSWSFGEQTDDELSRDVCVPPPLVPLAMRESVLRVQAGLPHWQATAIPQHQNADVKIAYLIQLSVAHKLPLVRRTFDILYSSKDVFLYWVDEQKMNISLVHAALPQPLPSNVFVLSARHAGYFYWPRVQVLLNGLSTLLEHEWDFVAHLSESCYPLHTSSWMHQTLSLQRNTNFINLQPRCTRPANASGQPDQHGWYWWSQTEPVASCGRRFRPRTMTGMSFPLDGLESSGFRFAHGSEWMILTREFVNYVMQPELVHYKRLVGMHAAADEIFWATMVLNIPNFTQAINPQGWYIKWPVQSASHSPETLTLHRAADILANRHNFFFARKVHEVSSEELLQKLDVARADPDDVHKDTPGPMVLQDRWDHRAAICHSGSGANLRDSGLDPVALGMNLTRALYEAQVWLNNSLSSHLNASFAANSTGSFGERVNSTGSFAARVNQTVSATGAVGNEKTWTQKEPSKIGFEDLD